MIPALEIRRKMTRISKTALNWQRPSASSTLIRYRIGSAIPSPQLIKFPAPKTRSSLKPESPRLVGLRVVQVKLDQSTVEAAGELLKSISDDISKGGRRKVTTRAKALFCHRPPVRATPLCLPSRPRWKCLAWAYQVSLFRHFQRRQTCSTGMCVCLRQRY
jgi:ribosomal protein L32E